MSATTFEQRRTELEAYFDRTAAAAWARLTSAEPLGRIRATVRAGRERMRATLLGMLPEQLDGCRLLDAGSGTGALSVALADRGAEVTAAEHSPTLSTLARERAGAARRGCIRFFVGDMTDPATGRFTHIVAMDSLIHYAPEDMVRTLVGFAARTDTSILFTFAPRTRLLAMFYWAGKLFPRGDRSPAIVPVAEARLRRMIAADPRLAAWRVARTVRIGSGFYTSQAMELLHQ